jgi:ABC-2 type transport system permease protein
MSGLGATLALFRREMLRHARQPSRIVASLGTAALFWMVIGSGFADSFRMPGADLAEGVSYSAYLLPGMVGLIVLMGTVFASISLIQDREEGFLQSVLVSPAPMWSVVLAKVGAGALVATLEALLLLAAGYLAGLRPGVLGLALAALAAGLMAAGIIALGLILAWRVRSVAGFHGMMNLVLAPMWLLSGALFPPEGAAPWLGWVMRLNPLHWTTRTMRTSLDVAPTEAREVAIFWGASILFTIAVIAVAGVTIRREARRGQ